MPPSFSPPDHYSLLGLRRGATLGEIQKAYRVAARGAHPDKNPHGAEAFRKLSDAYDVLRDAEQRLLYDCSLLRTETAGHRAGGSSGVRAASAAAAAAQAAAAAGGDPSASPVDTSWFFGSAAQKPYTPMDADERERLEKSVRRQFEAAHPAPEKAACAKKADDGRAAAERARVEAMEGLRRGQAASEAGRREAERKLAQEWERQERREEAVRGLEERRVAREERRRTAADETRRRAAERRDREKLEEIGRLRDQAREEREAAETLRALREEAVAASAGGEVAKAAAAATEWKQRQQGKHAGGAGEAAQRRLTLPASASLPLNVPSDRQIAALHPSDLLALSKLLSAKLETVRQVYLDKE